ALIGGRLMSRSIAVDTERIYWFEGWTQTVMTMPVEGGTLTPINFDASSHRMTMDDANIYIYIVGWKVVDGAALIANAIARVSKNGGSPFVLTVISDAANGMALDDKRVYWTQDDGRVMSINKDGSDLRELANGENHPSGIVVDDRFIFWTNSGSGAW